MKTNHPLARLLATLLGLTLAFLTFNHANAANLLIDGGFEFGQAPGTFRQSATYGAWTAVGANGPALIGLPYPQIPGLEGTNAMHIGNARLGGLIRQSFATTIGQQYVVRLWAVGYGTEAGSGAIRVYGSGQTNLTSLFSSLGGYIWRKSEFKFNATGANTTIELQNLPPSATTIDHVSVTPLAPASLPLAPEIETFSTDRFISLWSDSPSDAADAAFWTPSIPAGQDIYAFGHVVNPGYSLPPGVVVGKALTPTAFAFPLGFTIVWNDAGSDASRDGASWEPIPPAGYVSLGTALQDNGSGNPPPTNSLVCVREDLVVEGAVGDVIWTDSGSGADADFSAWKIVAPEGAIGVGAFTGVNSYAKPSGPVYCLKARAVAATAAPSAAELEQLLNDHGPIIRFHPAETYFPDDPAAILNRPDTTLQWSTVQNEGSWSGLNITNHAARYTSAGTILDDVQSALSHPQAGSGDFRYYLNFPQKLAGNLSQAKAYVRVQPYQGLYAELQFWIFYPWNAAGKIHASCVDIDYDPTGPVGQHWSDWESIRVRVSRKNVWNPGVNTLASVVMSRHDFDEEVAASDPRLQILSGRPVVYSAKGSHAHYPTANRQYYKTVGSKDVFFCTVYATLYDLTGNGVEFPTYLPANRLIVSSAWPGVATAAPDWLFFGGNWGNYEQQEFVVSDSGIEIYRFRQVEHGKPGLIRRSVWAVTRPENANLGTLRTSAGPISPTFSPLVANYSATVGSGVSQVTVTPQAADHTALVYIRLNGVTFTNGSGPLLGKASVPLNLNPGPNVISITVNSVSEGAVTAEKIYTLTVTRQTPSAIVSNTNDNGPGSLRQMIADVPAGTAITFAQNLAGQTIVLGGTQILLNKNLMIDATALPYGVNISGNNTSRVFEVASGTTVTLNRLTITGGNAAFGSGIRNSGTLFLNEASLVNNSTPGQGGAIYNSGALTLNNCTLSGNTSGAVGGGIANSGPLTLNNCTLSGNQSLGSNGQQGFGGGIFNFDVPLTLNHCTLAGNSAATLGGGLRTQGGTLNIENTIIAGNSAPTQGPDIANNGGTTIISTGVNLIGDNSTVPAQFPAGPLVGTTANPRDPQLAPLNYYLGPTTIRPPLPGSPVIDAAVLIEGTPAIDQRGAPRPAGSGSDLGAVEAFALSLVPLYDLDGDSIDDRIEPAYPQLTNGVNDRELDSDGDGSPDGEELYNMTNPLDPADYLHVLSFERAEGFDPATNRVFDLSFKSFPGLAYELETGRALPHLVARPGTQITATTTNVTLPVLLGSDAGFVRVHRGHTRWATRVLGFSSEYTSDAWSAAQALGRPDTYPNYGDIVTAWASASADDQLEFLELGFDAPAPINSVSIYETLAPGAVTKVSVRNPGTGLWVEVWSGPAAPALEVARIFTVTFPLTTFPVDAVRIELDSPAVPSWNEIDAVSIITGSP